MFNTQPFRIQWGKNILPGRRLTKDKQTHITIGKSLAGDDGRTWSGYVYDQLRELQCKISFFPFTILSKLQVAYLFPWSLAIALPSLSMSLFYGLFSLDRAKGIRTVWMSWQGVFITERLWKLIIFPIFFTLWWRKPWTFLSVWFPLLEGYENHLASTQPQFEYEVIYRILVCLLLFEQQRIFFLRKKTKFCWVGGWSICLQLNNNVYTRRTGTTTDRSASRQLVWSSFPPLNTCIPFSGTTKVF